MKKEELKRKIKSLESELDFQKSMNRDIVGRYEWILGRTGIKVTLSDKVSCPIQIPIGVDFTEHDKIVKESARKEDYVSLYMVCKELEKNGVKCEVQLNPETIEDYDENGIPHFAACTNSERRVMLDFTVHDFKVLERERNSNVDESKQGFPMMRRIKRK